MPVPLKYEVYEVTETRGDGRLSPVREVLCLYRVSDGLLISMRDPAIAALVVDEEPCAIVKRRGGCGVGYACNRPKGHQGRHAFISREFSEKHLTHAWDEADCAPEDGTFHPALLPDKPITIRYDE